MKKLIGFSFHFGSYMISSISQKIDMFLENGQSSSTS